MATFSSNSISLYVIKKKRTSFQVVRLLMLHILIDDLLVSLGRYISARIMSFARHMAEGSFSPGMVN